MQPGLVLQPPAAKDGPPIYARSGGGDVVDSGLYATRILIVEDEVMIAWMLESILEDLGFANIEMAATGAQARAAAARARPGLILSDINLGAGPDGIDTAIEIARSGPVPVIFVTAYADEATRARINREMPSASLLRKPLQTELVGQTVLAALEAKARH